MKTLAEVVYRFLLRSLPKGLAQRTGVRRREPRPRATVRAARLFDSLANDLRHAARTLGRSPSFTLVAAITLALGIGGVTVGFSLVQGVLLRPLPFPSAHELVVLRQSVREGPDESLSFPNYDDLRTQSRTLSGVAAIRFAGVATILGGSEPARGTVLPVSREFFSVVGVSPFLGRAILPAENRPGGDAVAVVSHEFWARVLGSEARLDRLRLTIDGSAYSVVGVMPAGFRVLDAADVYLPLERNAFMKRDSSNYVGIGRLAGGAGAAQARAELDTIASRIRQAHPDDARLDRFTMRPLRDEVVGHLTRPLLLLLGASGLLLLLACSNVASTLMARSVRRQKELAIRAALGSRRARLVRLVFTENLLLATLAGAGGVGLALATLRILPSVAGGFLPRLAAVTIDTWVLAVAVATTLVAAVLPGLGPALRLPEPAASLRSGTQGGGTARMGPGWDLLVVVQVALAVCLVVASGLLVRSMREILSADTHVRPEGLLTVALDFSGVGREARGERHVASLMALKSDLRAIPGVTGVGFVSFLPHAGQMMTGGVLRPPIPAQGLPDHFAADVGWRVVDQDYFRVMGIPLRKGRFFTERDRAGTRPVIILNESVARILFPDREAVGSIVQFDPFWRDTDLEVVGVVSEARDWRVPAGEQREAYVLAWQRPAYARSLTAVLRTSGRPADLIAPARRRLRSLAPSVPGTFQTMESLLADSYRDRTFTLQALGVFTLVSLVLSAVGVYGVVSYGVSARSREIGIMLALGATRGALRAQIFFRSARAVAAGLAVGVGLAAAAGGVLRGLLYRVEPWDPLILALASSVLALAASAAILLPVVQHTRVDPVEGMRTE